MVILIQCKDKIGLVAAIAGVIAQKKINIVSMREHVDKQANRFFTRIVTDQSSDVSLLVKDLQPVLPEDAVISINPETEKKSSCW